MILHIAVQTSSKSDYYDIFNDDDRNIEKHIGIKIMKSDIFEIRF